MRTAGRQFFRARRLLLRDQRRLISHKTGTFEVGDIAILRPIDDPEREPILTKPLKHDGSISTRRGAFKHSDIIGEEARSNIKSSAGGKMRAHIPTLAEYTALTPRRVTPVYAGEANIIVSLLDIHVTNVTKESDNQGPMEILEAGTGHGALTLHLARAIHAANGQSPTGGSFDDGDASINNLDKINETRATWKQSRKAIVHTVDISSANSAHARGIVGGFRRGIYAGNVDFHIGDVPSFLRTEFERRQSMEPFLSCVVLDLVSPDRYLQDTAEAMLTDATLAVFCPNVTQLGECVRTIQKMKIPFTMDRVVELGANNSAGRHWDVRAVRPKGTQSQRSNMSSPNKTGVWTRVKNIYQALRARPNSVDSANERLPSEWEIVCRPKTRYWVHGGGFLGVWRRMKY